MSSAEYDSQAHLQQLARKVLERLPPGPQQVLWFGAVPAAFNFQLIGRMAGAEIDLQAAIALLGQFRLVTVLPGGWLVIPAELRRSLLAEWHSPEQREELRKANHIAQEYFSELAAQAALPARYTFQQEALFHSLLVNEQDGLSYLDSLFSTALDEHQPGLAQDYCTRLENTLLWLTPRATLYHRYYLARLAFGRSPKEPLQASLQGLAAEGADARLLARMNLLEGEWKLAQNQWQEAVAALRSAIGELHRLKEHSAAARAMLALGKVYSDLVEDSGGLQQTSRSPRTGLQIVLNYFVFLPYNWLDWLRRRVSFFPTSLALTGNYQEWIFSYLLRKAGSCYKRARSQAESCDDRSTALEAEIQQAYTAVGLRRYALAQNMFRRLSLRSEVKNSRYRTAQILLGLGRTSLQQGQVRRAETDLVNARNIFIDFDDGENIGLANRSLGQTYLRQGHPDSAAQALLHALQTYTRLDEPLACTMVADELEDLQTSGSLPPSMTEQAKSALQEIPQRQYLARLSERLLDRVRSMAYLLTMPISCMVVLLLGIVIVFGLLLIETIALDTTGALSTLDIVLLLIFALLPVPLSLWTIQLVYSILGRLWVPIIGRRNLDDLSEPPVSVTLAPDALLVGPYMPKSTAEDQPLPNRLPYEAIQGILSADYRLWKNPIYLLSRQHYLSPGKSVVLEGITSGYERVLAAIQRKISKPVQTINQDVIIIANPWLLPILLIAILHAWYLLSQNQANYTVCFASTGDLKEMVLSPILSFTILNLLFLFPPVTLWQVYARRRAISRLTDRRPRILSHSLLLTTSLVFTVIAIVWLISSPTLQIGPKPETEECASQSLAVDPSRSSEPGFIHPNNSHFYDKIRLQASIDIPSTNFNGRL